MEIILYVFVGVALGVIGWLIGKSKGRIEWEQKNAQAWQQYVDLEKELVSYRASQTAQLNNMQ